MWRFKGCPRCKGDLRIDEEDHHLYEYCLQCGYSRDMGLVAKAGVGSQDRVSHSSLAS